MEKLFVSKMYVEKKSASIMKSRLIIFLRNHSWIHCKALNRKIFLSKLPDAIIKRSNAKNRLQCFWVALDILKKSHSFIVSTKNEYEIKGLSADGNIVFIHLREEKISKDKMMFLISTYHKKAPNS